MKLCACSEQLDMAAISVISCGLVGPPRVMTPVPARGGAGGGGAAAAFCSLERAAVLRKALADAGEDLPVKEKVINEINDLADESPGGHLLQELVKPLTQCIKGSSARLRRAHSRSTSGSFPVSPAAGRRGLSRDSSAGSMGFMGDLGSPMALPPHLLDEKRSSGDTLNTSDSADSKMLAACDAVTQQPVVDEGMIRLAAMQLLEKILGDPEVRVSRSCAFAVVDTGVLSRLGDIANGVTAWQLHDEMKEKKAAVGIHVRVAVGAAAADDAEPAKAAAQLFVGSASSLLMSSDPMMQGLAAEGIYSMCALPENGSLACVEELCACRRVVPRLLKLCARESSPWVWGAAAKALGRMLRGSDAFAKAADEMGGRVIVADQLCVTAREGSSAIAAVYAWDVEEFARRGGSFLPDDLADAFVRAQRGRECRRRSISWPPLPPLDADSGVPAGAFGPEAGAVGAAAATDPRHADDGSLSDDVGDDGGEGSTDTSSASAPRWDVVRALVEVFDEPRAKPADRKQSAVTLATLVGVPKDDSSTLQLVGPARLRAVARAVAWLCTAGRAELGAVKPCTPAQLVLALVTLKRIDTVLRVRAARGDGGKVDDDDADRDSVLDEGGIRACASVLGRTDAGLAAVDAAAGLLRQLCTAADTAAAAVECGAAARLLDVLEECAPGQAMYRCAQALTRVVAASRLGQRAVAEIGGARVLVSTALRVRCGGGFDAVVLALSALVNGNAEIRADVLARGGAVVLGTALEALEGDGTSDEEDDESLRKVVEHLSKKLGVSPDEARLSLQNYRSARLALSMWAAARDRERRSADEDDDDADYEEGSTWGARVGNARLRVLGLLPRPAIATVLQLLPPALPSAT